MNASADVELVPNLIRHANEKGISPRLFGGVAYQMLFPEGPVCLNPGDESRWPRPKDVDVACYSEDADPFSDLLCQEHGALEDPYWKFMRGPARRRFLLHDFAIDLHVRQLRMCFDIPFQNLESERLIVPPYLLAAAALQATRLLELPKQLRQFLSLLYYCPVEESRDDSGQGRIVDPRALGALMARNWSLYQTAKENLRDVQTLLGSAMSPAAKCVIDRVTSLESALGEARGGLHWYLSRLLGPFVKPRVIEDA